MDSLILYYDSRGAIKSIAFETVVRRWVNEDGGITSVLNSLKAMNKLQLENIPLLFTMYFMDTYKAKLPDEYDPMFQDYLYDVETYLMYLKRMAEEYDSRPSSPSSIVFMVVIVLAILGLVSLCSNI